MSELVKSLRQLIVLALRDRDNIYAASGRDANDADYKKRVAEWYVVGGAYPAGSLTELISSLLPRQGYGDFEKAVQSANSQVLELPAAGFLLPKIEAAATAHRALLNAAVAISQGDLSHRSQEYQDAELALNEVVCELISLANASPLPESKISEERQKQVLDLIQRMPAIMKGLSHRSPDIGVELSQLPAEFISTVLSSPQLNTAEPVAETPPNGPKVDLRDYEADDKLPAAKRKLSPSRVKAKAAYDWAMSAIPNSDSMTIAELFDAIQHHPSNASDALPDNAETFRKYLNDAGVKINGKGGDRRQDVHGSDEL